MDDAERFWRKVDRRGPDECWPWVGQRGIREGAYGKCRWHGVERLATHVALELDGRPLAPGQYALHSCDNPPCVNPAHLRGGSQGDNARDAVNRGRHFTPPAIAKDRRKMTAEQADEARAMRAEGASYRAIGTRFNVDPKVIWQIVNGASPYR